MAETMLKITDLVSSYGNIKALKGISMEIQIRAKSSPFWEPTEPENPP